jgi:hypothetical protein
LAILPRETLAGFVFLVEEEDPFALSILASFFALLKLIVEPWWLKGKAEFEVEGWLD